MSQAKITFDDAIRDAEELLAHFDRANTQPPPENAEVLKRAGLIMAFTAWETYVEDRATEALRTRIAADGDSPSARFVQRRLEEELKRFNNPNTEKTRKLFQDFLEVDVTSSWQWHQCDSQKAKMTLGRIDRKARPGSAQVKAAAEWQSGAPPCNKGRSETSGQFSKVFG